MKYSISLKHSLFKQVGMVGVVVCGDVVVEAGVVAVIM